MAKKIKNCSIHGPIEGDNLFIYETEYSTYRRILCKTCKDLDDKEAGKDQAMWEHDEKLRKAAEKRRDDDHYKYWANREKRKIDELWDEVVVKELRRGIRKDKYLYTFPKELIQAKRASMKLERALESIKKAEKEKKDELVRIEKEKYAYKQTYCLKHGLLKDNDLIKQGLTAKGHQISKCKHCRKHIRDKNYQTTKDVTLKRTAQYRKNNPEKIKEIRKNYKVKMYDKYKKHDST